MKVQWSKQRVELPTSRSKSLLLSIARRSLMSMMSSMMKMRRIIVKAAISLVNIALSKFRQAMPSCRMHQTSTQMKSWQNKILMILLLIQKKPKMRITEDLNWSMKDKEVQAKDDLQEGSAREGILESISNKFLLNFRNFKIDHILNDICWNSMSNRSLKIKSKRL